MANEVMKNVHVPISLHKRIKIVSVSYGIGMSELVTKILDAKIKQFEEHLKNKEQIQN